MNQLNQLSNSCMFTDVGNTEPNVFNSIDHEGFWTIGNYPEVLQFQQRNKGDDEMEVQYCPANTRQASEDITHGSEDVPPFITVGVNHDQLFLVNAPSGPCQTSWETLNFQRFLKESPKIQATIDRIPNKQRRKVFQNSLHIISLTINMPNVYNLLVELRNDLEIEFEASENGKMFNAYHKWWKFLNNSSSTEHMNTLSQDLSEQQEKKIPSSFMENPQNENQVFYIPYDNVRAEEKPDFTETNFPDLRNQGPFNTSLSSLSQMQNNIQSNNQTRTNDILIEAMTKSGITSECMDQTSPSAECLNELNIPTPVIQMAKEMETNDSKNDNILKLLSQMEMDNDWIVKSIGDK